jgi:hypothetical protein
MRMRLRRNSKGQMRVVETLLASFIFISALTFVNLFSTYPTSPKYEVSDLEKMGHNVLTDLDDRRILSDFVYNESKWEDLRLAVHVFLTPDIYFNLTIYDANGAVVNGDHPIFFGDPGAFASSTATASVTYAISGHDASYDPRILVLQLLRG